jgi:hypothetical protein
VIIERIIYCYFTSSGDFYTYKTSLQDLPDKPDWIHTAYNPDTGDGYIYGMTTKLGKTQVSDVRNSDF